MRREPYAQPMVDAQRKVYALNPSLVDWAYDLTRDTTLFDNEAAKSLRAEYKGFPAARSEPRVMLGDNLSASTFWHGALLNRWANDWVRYWTDGQGEFVTTAVEDGGILEALRFLDAGGRAAFDRVLVLRAASNFSMQPPGMSAAESLTRESEGFGGMTVAVEALWTVGSEVARALIRVWSHYEQTTPAPGP
jgi:purine nucleoside permease